MQNMNYLTPVIKMTQYTLESTRAKSKLNLNTGSLSCEVRTAAVPQKSRLPDDFVLLNKYAARELKLPGSRYLIYHHDDNSIYIGPVVGVMTTAVRKNSPPRGKTGRLFKEMIDYAGGRGIFVYLFHPESISKDHNYIWGITSNAKTWKCGIYAWPDIIYNRIRFRKIENQKEITGLLHKLNKDKRVYLFNSRFLNKREVYEVLKNHPQTQSLVPETEILTRRSLQVLLEKYSEVFLKPVDGSIGRGIYKIKCVSPGCYTFAGVSSCAPAWKGPYSFSHLYRQLLSNATSNKDYLVQQAVELAKYKFRIFDVRSQVQKNYQGEWILTGAAVRVAGKDRFVTHIPNGGRAEVFDDVINRVFGSYETRRFINQQLKETAALVPGLLEKELELNLGILTMDLGIDKNGRLWVLEVNSKPSSFDEDDIRMKHLQNLSDYFVYAAREKVRKGNDEV